MMCDLPLTSSGCLLLAGCSFAGAGGGGFLTIILKDSAHKQKVKSIIDTTVVGCFLPPSLLSFFCPSSISSSHSPQSPLFILLSILFFFLPFTLSLSLSLSLLSLSLSLSLSKSTLYHVQELNDFVIYDAAVDKMGMQYSMWTPFANFYYLTF